MDIVLGVSNFKEFRERKPSYYVDKTYFIKEFLTDKALVDFILRPRRFSKTMNLSMLKAFLELNSDNRSLFDGLMISQEEELMKTCLGKFPVIYIDFRGFEGLTKEQFARGFWNCLRIAALEHNDCIKEKMSSHPLNWSNLLPEKENRLTLLETHLAASERSPAYALYQEKLFSCEDTALDNRIVQFVKYQDDLKAQIKDLKAQIDAYLSVPKDDILMCCLEVLMTALNQYHGKKVVVLIDEYDEPLNKALQGNFFEYASNILGVFLCKGLKSSDSKLFKACIMGVAEVRGSGLMSLLNNFAVSSYLSDTFSSCFGFTVPEIEKLAVDPETVRSLIEWYSGYYFGNVAVASSWSIAMWYNTGNFSGHWTGTASKNSLLAYLNGKTMNVMAQLSMLLYDEGFFLPIVLKSTQVHFGSSKWSHEEIINFLILTGYLTYRNGFVMIPNFEVKYYWECHIKPLYESEIRTIYGDWVRQVFANFDAESGSVLVDKILKNASSFDLANSRQRESSYHCLLLGVFLGSLHDGMDTMVHSNKEVANGRFDIRITFRQERKAFVLEFKASQNETQMVNDSLSAIKQIKDKGYYNDLGGYSCHLIGIAFFKKQHHLSYEVVDLIPYH